jgi:hypothetical protein
VQALVNWDLAVSAAFLIFARSAAAIAMEVTRCRTKLALLRLTRDEGWVLDRRSDGEMFLAGRTRAPAGVDHDTDTEGA